MAMGIKTWDESGNVIQDETNRLTRVLGTVSTTTSASSLTDSRFLTGQPFAIVLGAVYDSAGKNVTFSGDTMSWTAATFSGDIIYGVY